MKGIARAKRLAADMHKLDLPDELILYTVPEAMAILNVTNKLTINKILRGGLEVTWVLGSRRVTKKALMEYLSKNVRVKRKVVEEGKST